MGAQSLSYLDHREVPVLIISIFLIIMLSRLSCVQLFATLWAVAHQAPLFMGFYRQEYWSGLPCPPPGNLPHPGMEPRSPASPALQVDPLLLSHQGSLFKRTSFLKWKRSFNRESREVVLLVKSVPGNQPTSKSNTLSFLPR